MNRPGDILRSTVLFIRQLWREEAGVIAASNYLLLVTIIAIGAIVGLSTIRNAVVQELGDVSLGLEHLDQTYTVSYTVGTLAVNYGYTDPTNPPNDTAGSPPDGIDINQPAQSEGSSVGGGGGGTGG